MKSKYRKVKTMGRRPYNSDLERFMTKIQEQDHGYTTPCMQWTAGTFNSGYGDFGMWLGDPPKVYSVRAHKWLYEQLIGPVPQGMELDHKCRNKLCCNPDHLEPVTHRENSSRGTQGILKSGRTSRYRGVSWDNQMKRWITKIQLKRKQYNLGYYETEEEAHQAYLSVLARYEEDGSVPPPKKHPKTSQYKGVSWDRRRGRWIASARIHGKQTAIGRFDTEEEAYQAYLKAIQ